MNERRTHAVIFDFDGVLVESTDLKTEAFATLYRPYGTAAADKAVTYHLAHAGISRHVKIRHLHEILLGIRPSDEEVARLGEQFSELVVEAVVAAPWVRGAREFVEAHYDTLALFVASGTPVDELKVIVSRRGMRAYFRSIHGAPATKGEIIRSIIAQYRFDPQRVLMVGDASADLEGARQVGARFIGRVHDAANPFSPDIPVIADLTSLSRFL